MKNLSYKFVLVLIIVFIILSLPAVAVEDNRGNKQNRLTEEQNIFEGNGIQYFDSLIPPGIIRSGEGPSIQFPGQGEFPGFLNPFKELDIEENDIYSGAFIHQIGYKNTGIINQEGQNNLASIYQEGDENIGDIEQLGINNIASINQIGSYNIGKIEQTGNGNLAIIDQEADDCFAEIKQTGNNNEAEIYQDEDDEDEIIQNGNGNSTFADIIGPGSVKIEQKGNNMRLNMNTLITN